MTTTLHTLSEIKDYFASNQQPYYFISSSNFNLMGMHHWVNRWSNINLIDCFDGNHPQVTVVNDPYSRVFEGVEDINHHLLSSEAVRTQIEQQANDSEHKGKALFLFF